MREFASRIAGAIGSKARRSALVLVVVLCAAKFAAVVNPHYPIEKWLVLRYLAAAGVAACFGLCCLLVGSAVLCRLRLVLPRAERLVTSSAIGMYAFFLAMFVGGLLHLYGHVFGVALPLVLGAIGIAGTRRRAKKLVPAFIRSLRRPARLRSAWGLPVILFGFVGMLLVYLPILTPDNASADSRWYHLTLAEHNVARGGLAPTVEGSYPSAYPQLATVIYSWALQLPRTSLFDRVEIAAHLEFVAFLFTLLGVGTLAARVVPRRHVGVTWAAVFLFPGLFLYDSNLSLAADHFLAFWGPPIFLALLRAYDRLDPRACALLALTLAGAALTKYQAGMLVIVPVLVVLVRAFAKTVRPDRLISRRAAVRGAAVAAGLAVVLTAPHWAKNAIWYHDPLYPLLHKYLPDRPWSQDAARYCDTIFMDNLWSPKGTLGARLRETFIALFTFSFEPHDWASFHGAVPVFGSMFTLTSLCIPLLGRARRIWGLALCTYGGLFIWYWGSHQDRYLQAMVPWMAACTAAVLVRLWSQGVFVRVATAALVGLQILWGCDVPFFPTHAFTGTSPYKTAVDLFSSGYRKDYVDRLAPFQPWPKIAHELPKGSVVLTHDTLGPFGLHAMTVSDWTGWQGGISYGRYRTPAEMHRVLRGLGVTDFVWVPDFGNGSCSIADDLVFYSFAYQHTESRHTVGIYTLGHLPSRPPPETEPGLVLVWGAVEQYAPGLHPVDALTVPGYGAHDRSEYPAPRTAAHGNEAELAKQATYIVSHSSISQPDVFGAFTLVMSRGSLRMWARTAAATAH